MKYNGIISKKIDIIYEELNLLHQFEQITIEQLDQDRIIKHALERSLQICVECMIDIANRIIALTDRAPTATAAEAMNILERLNIIKNAAVYKKMIQFRNFIVHRYESVDNEIIVNICKHDLADFEMFIKEIQADND
jgi:uncharacterized protein YutE (UPF0331/DUF86 family)